MTAVTSYEVACWNVSGKQIVLFRQDDKTNEKLKYKTEDEQSNFVEIPSHLYSNINIACNDVLLFHDVIQDNLHHSVEPSSFLPVLESDAEIKQQEQYVPVEHLKIALFGRGDSSTKTVQEASWGIFNERDSSTKRVMVQKIEGDLQECLVNVLFNHYHVSFYEDHRIEVLLDSNGQVQSLALTILSRPSFCSVFDKSISLDEDHWAVTLISTKQNFSDRHIRAGHAMIACEGVKERCKFLQYVHITKKPEKEDTTKFPRGARVQVLKNVSFIEHVGPTWRKPRSDVENMLVPLQQAHQSRQMVPFALGNTIYKVMFAATLVCFFTALRAASGYNYREILAYHAYFHLKNSSLSLMLYRIMNMSWRVRRFFGSYQRNFFSNACEKTLRGIVSSFTVLSLSGVGGYAFKKLSDRYDCLSWSIEQLSKAGINIRLPLSILTPNGAVEYLNQPVVFLKNS